jgi:hypothetical protein
MRARPAIDDSLNSGASTKAPRRFSSYFDVNRPQGNTSQPQRTEESDKEALAAVGQARSGRERGRWRRCKAASVN